MKPPASLTVNTIGLLQISHVLDAKLKAQIGSVLHFLPLVSQTRTSGRWCQKYGVVRSCQKKILSAL